MIQLGQRNSLSIVKFTDFGLYLDGQNLGELLLPNNERPQSCQVGDMLDVFIYRDSKDRLIATTAHPHAMVGQFAFLSAVSVDRVGAFLDWGLPKDLLVPFREQQVPMVMGQAYVVYVYLDNQSDRICASSQLNKFLRNDTQHYTFKQEVNLLITGQSDIGYQAIVDSQCWGLIHHSDAFLNLNTGQSLKGYIKKVRPDGKIDLHLQQPGSAKIPSLADTILDALRAANGFLPINDKSPPEVIYDTFSMSKKTFKKTIGTLYKKRLITIEAEGIRLH